MEITVTQEQGHVPVTVFHLRGTFTSDEQITQEARQVYQAGMRNLLIDLADVTYMSSAGLRGLYALYMMLKSDTAAESDEAVRQGIRTGAYKSPHLKLLKPAKKVLEVLKMSGYDMFLEIYKDRKEAIDSFA